MSKTVGTVQREGERLDRRTLSDEVAQRIRSSILEGRLKPGERLDQAELADRFGTSRMPVRDALRRLEGEGLVRIAPGRGAFVCVLDIDEFLDVYEVRSVLESYAAKKAAPRVSNEEIASLSDFVEQMEVARAEEDLGPYVQLDHDFHIGSYRSCGNPVLLRAIIGYWNSTQHYRRVFCQIPGKLERTQEEHYLLLVALHARDGDLFSQLVTEHIQAAISSVLAHLGEHDLLSEPHDAWYA